MQLCPLCVCVCECVCAHFAAHWFAAGLHTPRTMEQKLLKVFGFSISFFGFSHKLQCSGMGIIPTVWQCSLLPYENYKSHSVNLRFGVGNIKSTLEN